MPYPDHTLPSERPVSHFFPPISLTRAHISAALARSPDNGGSIDLSRRELTDLNEEAAEDLGAIGVEGTSEQCLVTRLALSHNRLATLPIGFAMLSRLRYLNLKHNSFTVFPDVLTLMPTLDTLDISHNKIKRLPSDPGCLTSLRVFVFSRNKVTKVPPYFANFRQLSILKADKNPVQWPPAHIMDLGTNPATMTEFISRLQAFLGESNLKTAALSRSMEALLSPQSSTDTHPTGDSSASPWSRFPIDDSMVTGAEETPHARSFSVDSTSVSSASESLPVRTPPELRDSDGHPKLHLGILKTYSMAPDSPDSYLPSPADSTFSTNTMEEKPLTLSQTSHFRGISYNEKRRSPEPKARVNDKISMPDLRTAKLNFTKKVNPLSRLVMDSAARTESGIPSPQSLRQDSGSSSSSQGLPSRPSAPSRLTKSSSHGDTGAAAQPVHSVDYERNSYFNRLSMLPVAAISNSLPEPLVHLVDSARTILFTLSQVYQAFDQFTIYTVDDRLPTILRKVLDPASADMMQLICSLDRFDALSRKVVPPPSACRTVVECCRDTVNAFSTALKALSLQLKVLANGKDVRYLRQMLLLLYGATAEISHAWQCLAPHLEAIKPLLHSKPYPTPSSTRSTLMSNSNTSHSTSEYSFGSKFSTSSPPLTKSHTPSGPPPLPTLRRPNPDGPRIRTSRRHAGSFSSKDVETGKTLPTYDILPGASFARGVISSTSTPTKTRMARRQGTNGAQPPGRGPTQAGDSSVAPWESSHLRGFSHTSSILEYSPPIPPRQITIDPAPAGVMSHVDKEALQAVKDAVDVAPAVWDAIGDILESGVEGMDVGDAEEILSRARAVTLTLKRAVRGMLAGDIVDTRSMRDDAHTFLKGVVQLSNLIKNYGTTHSVPPSLRANMVKLTNSTEEFAVLLHVSSFSPSAAPSSAQSRPYSPMISPMGGPSLGPSLSRSRSAQATRPNGGSALGLPTVEPPRSAQPMQTFKLPAVSAMRKIRGVAV